MSTIATFLGKLGETITGALTHTVGHTLVSPVLNAIGGWVLAGTRSALLEVARIIAKTTSPDLTAAWFTSTYWRVAGLAALLTLPFMFAAALQALVRTDPGLLAKVAFAYLPLAMVGVTSATPAAMLLLRATDEMCAMVSAAALTGGTQFLDQAAAIAGGLSRIAGSPFFAVVIGTLTVAAALALAVELLIREAAVYVVVLMLPLAFSAFVWPARRIWAIRLVELLLSLILAKFVIVAVLSLAGSAFSSSRAGLSELLTAMSLMLLSTFSPWVLLRILPFTELAAGAAGALRHELPQARARALAVTGSGVATSADVAATLPEMLRNAASQAGQGHYHSDGISPPGQQSAGPTATAQQAAPPVGGAAEPPTPKPEAPSNPHPEDAPSAKEPGPPPGAPAQSGDPSETVEYRHPLADIDPDLRFNTGPGGWWTREE